MLKTLFDILKSLPVILALIKEIRAEIDKLETEGTVKQRVNELREINKVKNVKALNDNLNGK